MRREAQQRRARDLAERHRRRQVPARARGEQPPPPEPRAERVAGSRSPIERTFRRVVELAAPATTYPAVPLLLLLALVGAAGLFALRRRRRG